MTGHAVIMTDMARQFTEAQKTARREYLKQWRRDHPEEAKAQRSRAYSKARVDPVAKAKNVANVLRWQKANPEKASVRNSRRYYAARKAGGERLSPADAAALWLQYDGLCGYCAAPATEFDHIHPVLKGGLTSPDNMAPVCRECNASKGAKALLQWVLTTGQPGANL